jgi:hypothetical protein
MLTRLHVLAGERDIEVSSESGYSGPGTPPVTARGGRTTSEWLDGQFFLIQRFRVENPAAPSGISIIGLEEASENFPQHYHRLAPSRPRLRDELG